MKRRENFIPGITHPLGASWNQPDPKAILLDDTHAVMSEQDFKKLAEYSMSVPSGVYVGKMWKMDTNWHRQNGDKPKWFLCWFGFSEKGEIFVSNNYREILIV